MYTAFVCARLPKVAYWYNGTVVGFVVRAIVKVVPYRL